MQKESTYVDNILKPFEWQYSILNSNIVLSGLIYLLATWLHNFTLCVFRPEDIEYIKLLYSFNLFKSFLHFPINHILYEKHLFCAFLDPELGSFARYLFHYYIRSRILGGFLCLDVGKTILECSRLTDRQTNVR